MNIPHAKKYDRRPKDTRYVSPKKMRPDELIHLDPDNHGSTSFQKALTIAGALCLLAWLFL